MLIGYIRVSKSDGSQSTDMQRMALIEAGVDESRIYEDHVSAGCCAISSPWSRHSTAGSAGCTFSPARGARINTTTPEGRMAFGIFAALAEYERALISERTKKGIEAARARGISPGCRHKISRAQLLGNITHPGRVRGRAVRVRMSRIARESIRDRNGFSRVATIGQTFLDMVQHPGLCGGMVHVLEVWEEHAITYLDHIIAAVSSASSVVKCRAGYIIEVRLGVKDTGVEEWHDCAQRGGSSRLDPSRPYLPEWSEKWMISLNA